MAPPAPVPPVTVPSAGEEPPTGSAAEAEGAAGEAEIDLEAQVVRFDGREVPFEIDQGTKHRLLNGLDDIGLTLQQEEKIAAYERERERQGPVTTAL